MIDVRMMETQAEFERAVQLQTEIWGYADAELLPARLFRIALSAGGQALGAFDGNRMVGFCLAIPGLANDGSVYLHSHMLGVLAGCRDKGVGRMLKLKQREDALSRNIPMVEWTFDPLEIKNAYFNMERLGAIVRQYLPNYYGITTSKLHGGLPTDRCVAEWWLRSPRVEAIVAGSGGPRPAVEACVEVPAEIRPLRKSDPARLREIQTAIREQFQAHRTWRGGWR
jgi:predicted GNAT superfamily acetyltransferase